MLYAAYQALSDSFGPWQEAAHWGAAALRPWGRGPLAVPGLRETSAALELFSRVRLSHLRPPFGIDTVTTDTGEAVAVTERVVLRTPFATLLRFERADVQAGRVSLPKVLIVAPLSGHFATLLTDTARTMLADHDVYITDWHNARHVSVAEGRFGLAEYVQHVIQFLETLGPETHLLAVCQPCVPALAAVALMAQRQHIAQPRSMTLMAGPIDTRINPTAVNELATSQPIDWFEQNLISQVPWRYPGAFRRVYPGFLQLTAFMSMNPQRHQEALRGLYDKRVVGEDEAANRTAEFYAEYFAVNDLPAEFYLETVAQVFQEYTLAKGEMVLDGERVDTAAIRRTALFTVEGERDDICAIGQTVAAHDLCPRIPPYLKTHHVQTGVGHYGVFSGRRWQTQIYPRVREMIHSLQ
ncbi:polyhydroxyalkanoate depolymerase [Ideonella oryzae]|uniref:Polyhydroxyalkanoate depolymerase n=1 Tax=Ideonella oryzae TaxID=2937441 RepID=A0ABT1BST2_9BURK|nr:polyhydroxyalkanoate depolymerase [Ideonella oryzae]MCO5979285.1 polyhydroxyalkanoate depolymerase [Ideonella oryzae]